MRWGGKSHYQAAKRLSRLPLSGVSQQFAEGRRAFVPRRRSNKYDSDSEHNVEESRVPAAAGPADRRFRRLSARCEMFECWKNSLKLFQFGLHTFFSHSFVMESALCSNIFFSSAICFSLLSRMTWDSRSTHWTVGYTHVRTKKEVTKLISREILFWIFLRLSSLIFWF